MNPADVPYLTQLVDMCNTCLSSQSIFIPSRLLSTILTILRALLSQSSTVTLSSSQECVYANYVASLLRLLHTLHQRCT